MLLLTSRIQHNLISFLCRNSIPKVEKYFEEVFSLKKKDTEPTKSRFQLNYSKIEYNMEDVVLKIRKLFLVYD